MSDNICPNCNGEVFQTHSEAACAQVHFGLRWKERGYVSMGEHPEIGEIIGTGLPVERHRLYLEPDNNIQGYIEFVYVPHWVEKAANLHADQDYGMTLVEFLEKMTPA